MDSTSFGLICVLRTKESEAFSVLEQTAHSPLAEATEMLVPCFLGEAQEGVICLKAGPLTHFYGGIMWDKGLQLGGQKQDNSKVPRLRHRKAQGREKSVRSHDVG